MGRMKQHSVEASLSPAAIKGQADNIAVCYGNAFRSTRGSRSVDRVGELFRMDRDIGIAIILRRQRSVVIDNDDLGESKSALCRLTVEQKRRCACLFHD